MWGFRFSNETGGYLGPYSGISASLAGARPLPEPQLQPRPPYRRAIKSKVNPENSAQNQFLNGLRASAEANLNKHFETMDPFRWVGKIICKDLMPDTGLPDIGGVVNYFPDRKLFEVVYRSGATETMDFEKLQGQRYIATLVGDDRDDIKFAAHLARWSKGVIDEEEEEDGGEDNYDEEDFKILTAAGVGPPPVQSASAGSSSSWPADEGKRHAVQGNAARKMPRFVTYMGKPNRPRTLPQYPELTVCKNMLSDDHSHSD